MHAEPIARLLVQGVEAGLLAVGLGGDHRDRAGDERELEVAHERVVAAMTNSNFAN